MLKKNSEEILEIKEIYNFLTLKDKNNLEVIDKNNDIEEQDENSFDILKEDSKDEIEHVDLNKNGFCAKHKKAEEAQNKSPKISAQEKIDLKENKLFQKENENLEFNEKIELLDLKNKTSPHIIENGRHKITSNGVDTEIKTKSLKHDFERGTTDQNLPLCIENEFYLDIKRTERKLSYTEALLRNEMENYRVSSVLDMMNQDSNEKNGDDMNEMDMPNPGSIQHFERLFYPSIPCKNCASCYELYEEEIFWN